MGLLRGLAPLLTADMLHMLRSAGHGDRIVLVDCNFPAFEVASKTVYGKAITLAGADLIQALKVVVVGGGDGGCGGREAGWTVAGICSWSAGLAPPVSS